MKKYNFKNCKLVFYREEIAILCHPELFTGAYKTTYFSV
jgi:hypothetical protein